MHENIVIIVILLIDHFYRANLYKACTKHLTKNMMGEEVGGVKKSNNANIHTSMYLCINSRRHAINMHACTE